MLYLVFRGNRLSHDSEHELLSGAYRAALESLRANDSLYCCNIVESDKPRFEVLLYVTQYDVAHPRKELL